MIYTRNYMCDVVVFYKYVLCYVQVCCAYMLFNVLSIYIGYVSTYYVVCGKRIPTNV